MKKFFIVILAIVVIATGVVGGKMLYEYNQKPKWIRVA